MQQLLRMFLWIALSPKEIKQVYQLIIAFDLQMVIAGAGVNEQHFSP